MSITETLRLYILLHSPEKLVSNDFLLSNRMVYKTSHNCLNSFKHCIGNYLKYPYSEV